MAFEEISGIEISDKSIKVIQGKIKGDKYFVSKLFIENSTSLSETLKKLPDLLKEINSKSAILLIPRNKFSVRYLDLPTKDYIEINDMIKFKAKKQFLYAQKEVIYAFNIVGISKQGHSKVMMAVSDKDEFNKYTMPFDKLNVEPEVVAMNSSGLASWYGFCYPQEEKTVCLIDLDWEETTICIMKAGDFIYSREISRGVKFIREEVTGINDLIMQIRRSVSAYNKEKIGPEIENILITGAVEEIDKLSSKLSETSELQVNAISPLDKVEFLESVNDVVVQVSNRISLSKLLGVLSGAKNFHINFFAEKRRQKERKLSLYRKFIVYGIISVLLLSSITAIIGWEFYRKIRYLKEVQFLTNRLESRIEKLKSNEQVVNKVINHLERRGTVLNVLKGIGGSIPDGVELNRLTYDYEKGKVNIDGVAASADKVTAFMRNLQSSASFSSASQSYVRDQRAGKKAFAIEITFLK